MHQLVIYNSVSESVLEMGFRSIRYNYKFVSCRLYRLMILNNIICFNVLFDGDINLISKDDGSSTLKIQDDTNKLVNDIKTAKSCQYYG